MKNQTHVNPENIFDGRSVPCSVKHGLIIQKWLNLAVGGYFVLLNVRDPARLREQFSAQWPDTFSWEYLVQGPDEFQVKITKLKAIGTVSAEVGCCGGH